MVLNLSNVEKYFVFNQTDIHMSSWNGRLRSSEVLSEESVVSSVLKGRGFRAEHSWKKKIFKYCFIVMLNKLQ
jgi:hypothetical protein